MAILSSIKQSSLSGRRTPQPTLRLCSENSHFLFDHSSAFGEKIYLLVYRAGMPSGLAVMSVTLMLYDYSNLWLSFISHSLKKNPMASPDCRLLSKFLSIAFENTFQFSNKLVITVGIYPGLIFLSAFTCTMSIFLYL